MTESGGRLAVATKDTKHGVAQTKKISAKNKQTSVMETSYATAADRHQNSVSVTATLVSQEAYKNDEFVDPSRESVSSSSRITLSSGASMLDSDNASFIDTDTENSCTSTNMRCYNQDYVAGPLHLTDESEQDDTMSMISSIQSRFSTDSVEYLFPHIGEAQRNIRYALAGIGEGTFQQKVMKAIRRYISGCRDIFDDVIVSTYKSRKLARSLSRTLDLIYGMCTTFLESEEYMYRITELVAIYLSCELSYSKDFPVQKLLIANRISNIINKHLKVPNEEITKTNILRMFVLMPKFVKERDILKMIFQEFIPLSKIVAQQELPDKIYVQYIIVFHQWRHLETDISKQNNVIDLANKFMRPSKSLCSNLNYARHLPKYEHRRFATKHILENMKFFHDLRNASIFDNCPKSSVGVVDLSDDEDSTEKSDESLADFADIMATIQSSSLVVKDEEDLIAATVDLTLADDGEDDAEELEWIRELAQNAIRLKATRKTTKTMKSSGSVESESDVITLDSDGEDESNNIFNLEPELFSLDFEESERTDDDERSFFDTDLISNPSFDDNYSDDMLLDERNISSDSTKITSHFKANMRTYSKSKDKQQTQNTTKETNSSASTITSTNQEQINFDSSITLSNLPKDISDNLSEEINQNSNDSEKEGFEPENVTSTRQLRSGASSKSNRDDFDMFISNAKSTSNSPSDSFASGKVIYSQSMPVASSQVRTSTVNTEWDKQNGSNTDSQTVSTSEAPVQIKKRVQFNTKPIGPTIPQSGGGLKLPIKPSISVNKLTNQRILGATPIIPALPSTLNMPRCLSKTPFVSASSVKSETIKQLAQKERIRSIATVFSSYDLFRDPEFLKKELKEWNIIPKSEFLKSAVGPNKHHVPRKAAIVASRRLRNMSSIYSTDFSLSPVGSQTSTRSSTSSQSSASIYTASSLSSSSSLSSNARTTTMVKRKAATTNMNRRAKASAVRDLKLSKRCVVVIEKSKEIEQYEKQQAGKIKKVVNKQRQPQRRRATQRQQQVILRNKFIEEQKLLIDQEKQLKTREVELRRNMVSYSNQIQNQDERRKEILQKNKLLRQQQEEFFQRLITIKNLKTSENDPLAIELNTNAENSGNLGAAQAMTMENSSKLVTSIASNNSPLKLRSKCDNLNDLQSLLSKIESAERAANDVKNNNVSMTDDGEKKCTSSTCVEKTGEMAKQMKIINCDKTSCSDKLTKDDNESKSIESRIHYKILSKQSNTSTVHIMDASDEKSINWKHQSRMDNMKAQLPTEAIEYGPKKIDNGNCPSIVPLIGKMHSFPENDRPKLELTKATVQDKYKLNKIDNLDIKNRRPSKPIITNVQSIFTPLNICHSATKTENRVPKPFAAIAPTTISTEAMQANRKESPPLPIINSDAIQGLPALPTLSPKDSLKLFAANDAEPSDTMKPFSRHQIASLCDDVTKAYLIVKSRKLNRFVRKEKPTNVVNGAPRDDAIDLTNVQCPNNVSFGSSGDDEQLHSAMMQDATATTIFLPFSTAQSVQMQSHQLQTHSHVHRHGQSPTTHHRLASDLPMNNMNVELYKPNPMELSTEIAAAATSLTLLAPNATLLPQANIAVIPPEPPDLMATGFNVSSNTPPSSAPTSYSPAGNEGGADCLPTSEELPTTIERFVVEVTALNVMKEGHMALLNFESTPTVPTYLFNGESRDVSTPTQNPTPSPVLPVSVVCPITASTVATAAKHSVISTASTASTELSLSSKNMDEVAWGSSASASTKFPSSFVHNATQFTSDREVSLIQETMCEVPLKRTKAPVQKVNATINTQLDDSVAMVAQNNLVETTQNRPQSCLRKTSTPDVYAGKEQLNSNLQLGAKNSSKSVRFCLDTVGGVSPTKSKQTDTLLTGESKKGTQSKKQLQQQKKEKKKTYCSEKKSPPSKKKQSRKSLLSTSDSDTPGHGVPPKASRKRKKKDKEAEERERLEERARKRRLDVLLHQINKRMYEKRRWPMFDDSDSDLVLSPKKRKVDTNADSRKKMTIFTSKCRNDKAPATATTVAAKSVTMAAGKVTAKTSSTTKATTTSTRITTPATTTTTKATTTSRITTPSTTTKATSTTTKATTTPSTTTKATSTTKATTTTSATTLATIATSAKTKAKATAISSTTTSEIIKTNDAPKAKNSSMLIDQSGGGENVKFKSYDVNQLSKKKMPKANMINRSKSIKMHDAHYNPK